MLTHGERGYPAMIEPSDDLQERLRLAKAKEANLAYRIKPLIDWLGPTSPKQKKINAAYAEGVYFGMGATLDKVLEIIDAEKRYDETSTNPTDVYNGNGPDDEYVCDYDSLKSKVEALRDE